MKQAEQIALLAGVAVVVYLIFKMNPQAGAAPRPVTWQPVAPGGYVAPAGYGDLYL